ncbi:MAG: alanine racemase [Pseudomonadota bacterium]
MMHAANNSISDTGFDSAPARLTIRLDHLVENWRTMDRLSGKARASAVVKADAYGLGIEPVGTALYAAGVRDFFVAQAAEGARLRKVAPDARIYVLSGIWAGMEKQHIDHDLVPVIASDEQLAFWMTLVADGLDHPCALNVDTGMNRLGLSVADAMQLVSDPARPAGFDPVLVMSHLACADDPLHPMNRQQCESFQKVALAFDTVESSLCNSAGIHLGPDFHFGMTRPGIALYGGAVTTGGTNPMLPVVTAKARIVQIRDAASGETVSYGATHRLTRNSRLAIAAAGYADGWHRALSGSGVSARENGTPGGYGFVAGYRVPIVGRITMDLTVFDVTDVPQKTVKTGDYIELFGPNIAVGDAAQAAGTIGYELLTGLGQRYHRSYTGHPVEKLAP